MLGHLLLAVAQRGLFSFFRGIFVRLVQEVSRVQSLQLEGVENFNGWADLRLRSFCALNYRVCSYLSL